MTHTPNRLLALKPGRRELGVAILQEEELLYYGVKTIHHRETPQTTLIEAVRILKKLIARYQPTTLMIEQTIVLQASASFLLVVAKKLKAAARRAGLTVYEYPPAEVRKFFCQPEKTTKLLMAQRITKRYPYLTRYLGGTAEWERLYYAYLFDAIALGLYGRHKVTDDTTHEVTAANTNQDETSQNPSEPQTPAGIHNEIENV